jgi:hypothetical protein
MATEKILYPEAFGCPQPSTGLVHGEAVENNTPPVGSAEVPLRRRQPQICQAPTVQKTLQLAHSKQQLPCANLHINSRHCLILEQD